MNYRQLLRELREDHDLTQAQVGKLLNKPQQSYSHIENGKAELQIDDLLILCEFYHVSADYIISKNDDAD